MNNPARSCFYVLGPGVECDALISYFPNAHRAGWPPFFQKARGLNPSTHEMLSQPRGENIKFWEPPHLFSDVSKKRGSSYVRGPLMKIVSNRKKGFRGKNCCYRHYFSFSQKPLFSPGAPSWRDS